MQPIYPTIEIATNVHRISLRTFLRKKYKGKYYLWEFYRIGEDIGIINTFVADIYMAIILGRVDLKLKDNDRLPLFKLDPDQTSEETRLKQINKL